MSTDLERQDVDVATANGSGEPFQVKERAVRAVFAATSHAWTDGDAGAFVARYTDDATVILPGVCLRGKADIRGSMAGAFAGPLKGSERIHAVQSIRFVGAEAAIVVTRSATTFPGETQPPADRWEFATWTLSRADSGWLIAAYHSCPEAVADPTTTTTRQSRSAA